MTPLTEHEVKSIVNGWYSRIIELAKSKKNYNHVVTHDDEVFDEIAQMVIEARSFIRKYVHDNGKAKDTKE